jgi:hypothetical protein
MDDPIFHKFVVFSKTDESGNVVTKLSKCNNCDTLHKVVDFCKSEIMHGKDEDVSVLTIDDISSSLPEKIVEALSNHFCDIATYEEVLDVIESQEWGKSVNISKTDLDSSVQVKSLLILENSFKIQVELYDSQI